MNGDFQQVSEFLDYEDELLVVSHFSPDGDAIGSVLAFSGILDQIGIKYILGIDDTCPNKYSFLPGFELIRDLKKQPLGRRFERIAILDAGALPRIGVAREYIEDKTLVLNIDHHFTGPYYGDINLVNVQACATAEILYDLCNALGLEIDEKIAYGLYVGILSDTGRFRFSNTNERSFKICSEMVEKGVDPCWVTENVYFNLPVDSVRALAATLSSLELYFDGLVCLIALDSKYKHSDSEGFVEHASSVKGVALATFIREIEKDLYKVSLRSRCRIDVATVARKFGGGGHLKAAGFRHKGKIGELKKDLLRELGDQLERHKISKDIDFIKETVAEDLVNNVNV